MKRYFRFIGGLLLMVALFSCNLSNIEQFQLGENFVDSNSGVVLIDTMTVYTSTVRFDSIVTNSLSSLLVGGYSNNYTGTVTCKPHFQFTSGSFTLPDKVKNLICDSLV